MRPAGRLASVANEVLPSLVRARIRWWKSIVFKRCRLPPNYSTRIPFGGGTSRAPRPRPPNPPSPSPFSVAIAGGAVHSRLGLLETFKGFEEQSKLLTALPANLQVLLDEVICFFDRPPLEGQLGETAQFPQALVAGQLLIPRAADGLKQGADLVV